MKTSLFTYIRRMKSTDKRAYAWAYYNWLIRDPMHKEQDQPSRCNLSVMAAQAVRMEIDRMMTESDKA